ncbi:DUF2155 domain-containing protein [Poseidonocella sedimentorum]|uniref:DUF2155 domain-containing protein n=1 Tax=Poseidonocella sedimentorum TaxID=871652 RepID=A0A1I6EHI2_9RHOB|nr:DUF2155 domain-containing protein [Poseidonocella sedimentorum]SFR17216.1 hypothetical protein SAMN04515673_11237 [Poseidonocella sedimentorum]
MKRLFVMSMCVLALPAAAQQAQSGSGAVIRALDRTNASVTDLEIGNGASARYGYLTLQLDECRYPVGDPSGDAYAYLTVREDESAEPVFEGWMVASSPALNAVDHPRYDFWVLRCKT